MSDDEFLDLLRDPPGWARCVVCRTWQRDGIWCHPCRPLFIAPPTRRTHPLKE